MKKKFFIITIDTEGDALWDWKEGSTITTENSLYLERFQTLCNKFNFKPVWLSNYEMLNDQRYVDFIRNVEKTGTGECGMHLHAWNTPPNYQLPNMDGGGAPYLIEYPSKIMEAKIEMMTNLIVEKVGIYPVSHRAGRWAMNDNYFELLKKHGYKVDCSIIPGINLKNCYGGQKGFKGPNYSEATKTVDNIRGVVEVPVSITKTHHLFLPHKISLKGFLKAFYYTMRGKNIWIRPGLSSLEEMKYAVNKNYKSNNDYLMFMIHSSELMPGGSHTFKTDEEIEKLYIELEDLFMHISQKYEGITLRDYYLIRQKEPII